LITSSLYLKLFSAAFSTQLGGNAVKDSDLPPGDRIIDRLNRYLEARGIKLKAAGGFNHYTVANYLASNPPKKIDSDTLARFEKLFGVANALYTAMTT